MSSVNLIATILIAIPGLVMFAITGYLVVLAGAALRYRPPAEVADPPDVAPVKVVIPAHNEELLIGQCVATLRNQTYPAERYGIVVVADNCTDQTATVAARAGASVLERVDTTRRGKGWALRFAFDMLLERPDAPRAVIIVDADGECDPRLIETLTGVMNAGARVVQAESAVASDGSTSATLRAAAFTLINRVRPQGRAVLGLPCSLQGTGMLFRRDVLDAFPWNAFTAAEDLQYATRLREGRVQIVYTSRTRVVHGAAPTLEASHAQQDRWVGGKFALIRTQVPRLLRAAVRQRRLALVDAAIELAVPPLALAAASIVAGLAVAILGLATGLTSSAPLVIWGASAVLLCCYVVVGFIAGHVPGAAWRALLAAPMLVLSRVRRLGSVVGYDADSWVRTPRPGEGTADDPPLDPLETPHR